MPLYAAGWPCAQPALETGCEPVRRLRWPVVSIGNLSTGGAGKTPLTIALAKALTRRGLHVDVLSRGYGRQSKLAARVDPERHRRGVWRRAAADCARGGRAGLRRRPALPGRLAGRGRAPDAQSACIFSTTASSIASSTATWTFCCSTARTGTTACCRPEICASRCEAAAPRHVFSPSPADDPALGDEVEALGLARPHLAASSPHGGPARRRPCRRFLRHRPPASSSLRVLRPPAFISPARIAFPDHHRYTAGSLARLASAAQGAHATALITTGKDQVRLGELARSIPCPCPSRPRRCALRSRIRRRCSTGWRSGWLSARFARLRERGREPSGWANP